MKNIKEKNFIILLVSRLFPCLLFLICTISAVAQVNFEHYDSFDAMKKKATKESKLIFIQRYSGDCHQCDELSDKSLSSSLLKEKYNDLFISAKIKKDQNFFSSLKDSALFKFATGSFYFNSNGDLLLQYNSTTDSPYKYLELADKAAVRSGRLNELLSIEKEYKSNKVKTPEFIRKYIRVSKEFDRNVDFAVEDYFSKLPIDSIYNKDVIRLVLEQGLPLSSRASILIHNNSPHDIDSIWNTIDFSKRVAINMKIIASTESIAIRTKDVNLAYQLSFFIKNIYKEDYKKADLYTNKMLLNFYKSINDSDNYIKLAGSWTHSLMIATNDILIKWDMMEQQLSANSNEKVKGYRKLSCEYASQLNNIAWSYYEMTTDLENLAKALKWVKRALEIHSEVCKPQNKDNPAFLDTYAHLLYKMNQFDEAISWEKKAIDAQRNAGYNSDLFEKELARMQNRSIK